MPGTLITGGAGFIGSNLTARLLDDGERVIVLDNFSRRGAETNCDWLQEKAGAGSGELAIVRADVTDADAVLAAMREHRPQVVFHEAGQVAVTTSVADPRRDFMENAFGTFNVLEGIRLWEGDAVLLFASTNKVYGGMEEAEVVLGEDGRYRFRDLPGGVPESWPLDFHSPYGCSKGAADQYVRDYARIYGMRNVVLRQSCIYGYRQFGVEDQGWIAWFTIATALGLPITVYGDGRQVRDALFIDDLVEAYLAASRTAASPGGGGVTGQVFNIGGGPGATLSLLELLEILGRLRGRAIETTMADWRPGDQRVFVADVSSARTAFGWEPRVLPEEGVTLLARWVEENLPLLERMFPRPS